MLTNLVVIACVMPQPAILSKESLLADFEILYRATSTLHPSTLRYHSPESLAKAWAKLKTSWSKDQPLDQAFLRLSEFQGTLKCGHSYPNFFNQSRKIQQEIFEQPNKLPFTFTWLNRKMVVTQDVSQERLLNPGDVIESINGISVSKIAKKILPSIRADGSNNAKRWDLLSVTGSAKYETFDVYHPLYFKVVNRLSLAVAGRSQPIIVTPISAESRIEKLNRPQLGQDDPLWQLFWPKADVAVLKMDSWFTFRSNWNWREFLRQSFQTLQTKSIKYLVIDIRNCEGGDDSVGTELARYLAQSPFQLDRLQQTVRYQVVPQDLRPYLDTWDQRFFNWGQAAQPVEGGMFRLNRPESTLTTRIEPAENVFKGRVWVLVSPTNSSATFQFAEIAKSRKLATLVGQPTGGNQRGITGGAFFFLRLPNIGLEVDIPLIASFRPDAPDAGITPDVRVNPLPADYRSGRDRTMETVLQRIDKTPQVGR
jgi:C-terminal processing protease CtpA/Prc